MRHGFLLIDKPTGVTSHDAVHTVRKTLHERDIGHLGTLDPNASGLLVLAVGAKALKLIEYFSDMTKEYEATVRFGAVSSTYDAEGVIEPVQLKPGVPEPTIEAIHRTIADRFIGSIQQVPPAHSAVHVNGQRAYDLARKGEKVDMPSRTVEVSACDVLSFAYPQLKLHVACGSGTYIRSLAHDLGQLLRCGAYLEALRRTVVGTWNVKDAHKPETATWANVIPLKELLKPFPSVQLTDDEEKKIRNGQRLAHVVQPGTIAWHNELPVAVMVPYHKDPSFAQPRKVL